MSSGMCLTFLQTGDALGGPKVEFVLSACKGDFQQADELWPGWLSGPDIRLQYTCGRHHPRCAGTKLALGSLRQLCVCF